MPVLTTTCRAAPTQQRDSGAPVAHDASHGCALPCTSTAHEASCGHAPLDGKRQPWTTLSACNASRSHALLVRRATAEARR